MIDPLIERLAFEQLHDNEALIAMLSDFVDGADVRMIQCRGGTSLPLKSLQRLWLAREFLR